MLEPNHRSLLTSLLTPPPGMVFDQGLATTYSLDPVTLLSVPVHLAWLASRDDRDILADPIRLLEALQRVTQRFTVFADRGRMHVPGQANALFALLENTITEVRAPRGGAFHPKLWLLRYVDEDGAGVLLRLGVLSRNLTADRSWDLSLVLEGRPSGSHFAANRELGQLLSNLPKWAVNPVPDARRGQVEALADELRRTPWEPPGAWEKVAFHVLGTKAGPWSPGEAQDIAVISPFLSDRALRNLCADTKNAMALVSRPDSLAALTPADRALFQRCLVLTETAETEDGEATEERDTFGLHAKALLLRRGWYVHLFVGSANATNAAMVAAINIEVMVELIGRHSQVGRVEDLLGEAGLGSILTTFDAESEVDPAAAERQRIEDALEQVHRAVAAAELRVGCRRETDGAWLLALHPSAPIAINATTVFAWLISVRDLNKSDGAALASGGSVDLATVDSADVTGLVCFELSLEGATVRFALNLPVDGLPADRDTAILRRIVCNRAGFLRYLRLLLGAFGADVAPSDAAGAGTGSSWEFHSAGASEALLEDMVRAFSREPARLRDVQRVVEGLRGQSGDDDGAVVPPDFDALWQVFEQALGAAK